MPLSWDGQPLDPTPSELFRIVPTSSIAASSMMLTAPCADPNCASPQHIVQNGQGYHGITVKLTADREHHT